MKKYTAQVMRTETSVVDVEVEANSEEEAMELAKQEAIEAIYPSVETDYEVEFVEEVDEEDEQLN